DVEDDEEQREHVVPHLALRPAVAHRVDATLVRDRLLRARAPRSKEAAEPEEHRHETHGGGDEDGNEEVAPKELGHRGGTLYASSPGSRKPVTRPSATGDEDGHGIASEVDHGARSD